MAKQQVFSEQEVGFGIAGQKLFWSWAGDNSTVPPDSILDVTTATFSYFPTNNGSVGRADLCGRNSGNNAVWRLQIVYVEPQRTVHLTFPQGLLIGPGGWVEVFPSADGDASPNPTGPGLIWVSFSATMDSVVSRPRPRPRSPIASAG